MSKIILNLVQTLILSALFAFSFVPTSQAQDWVSQNGNATSSAINEVQYVTNQIVFAVGNTGTIIKSVDGGESWTDVSYGDTRDLRSLYFFDENTGFVGGPFNTGGGGSSEMLAKTSNGGETWDVRSSFDFNDFNDIEFLNAQTGWVASAEGDVLYTVDGGENWSSYSAGSEDLLDINIVNDTTLWVSGKVGSLYKTTNGGTSWESAIQLDTISVGEYETLSPYDQLYGVEFATDSIGYVIGKKYSDGYVGILLKTTDAGENWSVVDHDFQHLLYDIEIGPNDEIVLAGGTEYYTEPGNGNAIYISEDEGASWKIISNGDGTLFWDDLDVHGNNWIAGGESGATTTFALSDDTLITNLLTGYNIADIAFSNNSTGAFVTAENFNGKVFVTTDGGESWTESLALEGRKDFTSVSFADEDNIWAIGNDHYTGGAVWLIYHSSDKGQNWTKVELDYTEYEQSYYLDEIQFLDSQNGFIKSRDKLLQTTDGGSTWVEINEPASLSFTNYFTFQFLDDQNGWLAGNNELAVTTDGGATWEVTYQDENSTSDITNIQFVNSSVGYVTMENGDFMKSVDGGFTWVAISTFSYFDLNDLHFLTADSGFVVGDGGRILTTVDGGETFETTYEVTKKNLSAVYMLDENNGWIVGEKGLILSTSNGGGIATSIEESIATEMPSDIKLQQNYPNPFNPSTVIEFELSQTNRVKLEVFDLMGRKVRTLLSENLKNAGQHAITFEANDLASGTYIYRLTVGADIFTKKLTLIK